MPGLGVKSRRRGAGYGTLPEARAWGAAGKNFSGEKSCTKGLLYSTFGVLPEDADKTPRAVRRRRGTSISLRDAPKSDTDRLCAESTQHGQTIKGTSVEDPLLEGAR